MGFLVEAFVELRLALLIEFLIESLIDFLIELRLALLSLIACPTGSFIGLHGVEPSIADPPDKLSARR